MTQKTKLFRATHFQSGPQKLTISGIETPKRRGSGPSQSPLIRFRESERRISLTRKRANLLVELFGEDSKAAIGKKIELFSARGRFKGAVRAFVAVRSAQ
ncbi:MAG TPA: hypothetical protein VEJ63_23190 [Planctomycetota bacterium]|nr:hypothetical protein [Planctomycetota bacterium]